MSKRKYVDLSGNVYGSWTVCGEEKTASGARKWVCACVCGEVQVVRQDNLLQGKSTQCRKCSNKVSSFSPQKIPAVPTIQPAVIAPVLPEIKSAPKKSPPAFIEREKPAPIPTTADRLRALVKTTSQKVPGIN